jgi:hypothetical protein
MECRRPPPCGPWEFLDLLPVFMAVTRVVSFPRRPAPVLCRIYPLHGNLSVATNTRLQASIQGRSWVGSNRPSRCKHWSRTHGGGQRIQTMTRSSLRNGIWALAGPLALAQTSTWIPGKAHSEVDFTILHLDLSSVHRRFGDIDGTISWNDADRDGAMRKPASFFFAEASIGCRGSQWPV